ncbi:phosphatase PAP2 family protein [Vibrio spartinae]|uniref:undecaprenyl-diphosphate phosphatase n=1 Tax=Vibrio spartinae TaxID=1918945 RepID=A0A1N6M443_9VIBR|nr:phosphatase PAP2 family protein [Vibrio spartinae]QMV13257.1 undecaprenyl pyrophosphate phosphatase [Vibrio spartinae]SIO94137.1 undecaprenyl pyrophosphate phosphatase [Vibrio spartinae]
MRVIEPIVKFDLALSLFCLQHRFSYPLARISRAVSHTGDGHLYVVIGGAAFLVDEIAGQALLVTGLISFLIELPLYWLLKNLFQRRRPQEFSSRVIAYITPSDRFSLPSGHTSAAFLMATLIASFYPSLSVMVFLWAGCIGAARILLGVHFFTDVLIGALLGMSCAQAGQLVMEWMI